MGCGGIDTGEKFFRTCLGKLGWSRQARPALAALSMGLHVLEAGRLSASARVGRASMGGAEVDNLPAAPSYLTAPAVSPPTMYFCRNRNNAITGAAAMIAPAEKALQSA